MDDRCDARAFKTAVYDHLATVGKALSSSTRLEILHLLGHSPRTVESIAGAIDQSVANTSHHLQRLKKAQLVTCTRDGVHKIYALSGDDVAGLVHKLDQVARRHIEDLEKLATEFFDAHHDLEAIEQATLLERMENDDVVLVDVRSKAEYEAGHLPKALSVPLEELDECLDRLPRDQTIVAYCRGPYCALSAEAVRLLRENGFDAKRSDIEVSAWDGNTDRVPPSRP